MLDARGDMLRSRCVHFVTRKHINAVHALCCCGILGTARWAAQFNGKAFKQGPVIFVLQFGKLGIVVVFPLVRWVVVGVRVFFVCNIWCMRADHHGCADAQQCSVCDAQQRHAGVVVKKQRKKRCLRQEVQLHATTYTTSKNTSVSSRDASSC